MTLVKPAPAGGAYLELSISAPGVVTAPPANLTIPAGTTQATFTVQGINQSQEKAITITSRWAADTISNSVSVNPVGSWSEAAVMPQPRGKHTATLLNNGKVLIYGGYPGDYGYPLLAAELYDPATNTWINAARMDKPNFITIRPRCSNQGRC